MQNASLYLVYEYLVYESGSLFFWDVLVFDR